MEEWNSIEDAVREQRWKDAATLARAFLTAWKDSKSSVLWFATERAESYMDEVDAALSVLVSALEHDPVDAVSVQSAKSRVHTMLPLESSP
jgi:hypothetical protein